MMTAEQLKSSILALAMQGKLVEQRLEEGTGEQLYKKIQAEKNRLIKEGKIKKQKPLQEINEDEIPFDIPAHWIWIRIGEVTFMEAGGTPARTKSEYWNGNIPWVKIGDMHGKYTSATEECITQKGLECSTAKVFKKGTVLYSIFASIGTVSILTIDAATNQAIVGISHTNAIDNEYLYYVLMGLKSVVIQKQHGMAQMNINQTILKEALFPLPPLAEQKRIVAKIEELMPFVEQYAAASTKLNTLNASFPEMMKKSILQEAVQGKLVPQDPNDEPASVLLKEIAEEKKRLIKEGKIKKAKPLPAITEDEIPFDIPDNWEWVRLTDIGDVSRGRSQHRPRGDAALYIDGIYPLVQTGDVAAADKYLTGYTTMYNKKGLEQSKMWPKGTLCITIAANIGDVAILDFDACFPDSVVGFTPYTKGVVSEYVYYMLQAFKPILDARSTKVAQKNLNVEKLSNIWFPLPPTEEQKKITIKLDECLTQLQKLDNQASLKK